MTLENEPNLRVIQNERDPLPLSTRVPFEELELNQAQREAMSYDREFYVRVLPFPVRRCHDNQTLRRMLEVFYGGSVGN